MQPAKPSASNKNVKNAYHEAQWQTHIDDFVNGILQRLDMSECTVMYLKKATAVID